MKLRIITKGMAAALLALTVSGCGFQLRESAGFPAELSPLYLSQQQHTVYSSLLTRLQQGGVELTDQQKTAQWRLWLSDVRHTKRRVTYTSGASSYDLQGEIDFQLLDARGKAVTNSRTLRSTRTYTSNESLYSEASDIAALRYEIERDLARRISQQLSKVQLPSDDDNPATEQ